MLSLTFQDCHAKIRQVDSQATVGNAVVVQVLFPNLSVTEIHLHSEVHVLIVNVPPVSFLALGRIYFSISSYYLNASFCFRLPENCRTTDSQ